MLDYDETYNKKLAQRLCHIMNILDMTYVGFAEFVERDVSHIYGIINQSRPCNHTFAEHISNKLEIKGAKILNLNVSIPSIISKLMQLLPSNGIIKIIPNTFYIPKLTEV